MAEEKIRTKDLKIKFVSGHSGTDLWEVASLVGVLPAAVFVCWKCLGRRCTQAGEASWQVFALEQLLVTLPVILFTTLLSNWTLYFVLGVASWATYDLLVYRGPWGPRQHSAALNNHHVFISSYKAVVQLATAVCILAVDFHIFPRRFAKAEVYGLGLMDTAVGIIVFSMGITDRDATSCLKNGKQRASVFAEVRKTLPIVLVGLFRVAAVKMSNYHEHVTEYGVHWNFFFTLGVTKVAATSIVSVCRPIFHGHQLYMLYATVLISIYEVSLQRFSLAAIIQDGLSGDGSRRNFVDANREGLFSCVGYLSIYFVGMFCGGYLLAAGWYAFLTALGIRVFYKPYYICFATTYGKHGLPQDMFPLLTDVLTFARESEDFWSDDFGWWAAQEVLLKITTQSSKIAKVLGAASVLAWMFTLASIRLVTPISRQMANFSFWIVQIAINTQLLASFALLDVITSIHDWHLARREVQNEVASRADVGKAETTHLASECLLVGSRTVNPIENMAYSPLLLQAINRHLLLYFLIANLSTGFVNFAVDTLMCKPFTSLMIISAHALFVNSVIYVWFRFRRKI